MEATVLELDEFQTEDVMSLNHSIVSYRLIKSLSKYDQTFSILPELELELSTGRSKPDISIYPLQKNNWRRDVIRMMTPPLLAIEILSPRQALSDLTDKAQDVLFPASVPSVWIFIPLLRQLTVLKPDNEEETFTSGVFKDEQTGIEVDLNYIFE